MKKIIFLILFIIPFVSLLAQDSTKVNPPKIITKLKVGNTVNFNTTSIKFLKVIEDSRCPSDVTCIWAGQVKIAIGIYKSEVLIEEKELLFGTDGINPNHIKEVLKIDQKTVYSYNISPYPSAKTPIIPSEYYLQLLIK
ncbi:hypothetical protein [Aquimarina macrocephali]|uniref:hypothetical protein n=1 Tax=Aquimarina macrocephali TaxID=666563 RepID=UPI0004678B7C|nr:hypothetical protein [Aquimarina macrocephali]